MENKRSKDGQFLDSSIGDESSIMSGISSKISSLHEKQSTGTLVGKKGIPDALKEIKSTEPALRGEIKVISSEMQERMQSMKISAIADKFEEKAGTKLPSIKQKILRKQKDGDEDARTDDDMVSLASIFSRGSSQKTEENISQEISSKIQREAEKMTKAFNAAKSLERLTLPTPATIKQTNYVKSKCEKFSSYKALEEALDRQETGVSSRLRGQGRGHFEQKMDSSKVSRKGVK